MKKVFFLFLLALFISNNAFAQRQTFITSSKDYYDAIMIDWVRSGNNAQGSWTRIKVSSDNEFTKDRFSINATISKNAVSISLGVVIINGYFRGKNLVLSLEDEDGSLVDSTFYLSSINAFNKIIQTYKSDANKMASTAAKQAAEDQRREDLTSRYTELQDQIESNYLSALQDYKEIFDSTVNQDNYYNLVNPKGDYGSGIKLPFYQEISVYREKIKDAFSNLEDFKSHKNEWQCRNRDRLVDKSQGIGALFYSLQEYKDHIRLANEFLTKRFKSIFEYLRVAAGLQKSLEDSIKSNKASFFKVKYSKQFLEAQVNTIKKSQNVIQNKFLINVETSKTDVLNLFDQYFLESDSAFAALDCS